MSVTADCHNLPLNEFTACLKCILCGSLQSAAAGHLHPHDCYALEIVISEECSSLFGVVLIVRLWTPNDDDLSLGSLDSVA